jgi:adenosylhomocysteine nucleosidase
VTVEPTVEATVEPTVEPTVEATVEPTEEPTVEATPEVTATVVPPVVPPATPTEAAVSSLKLDTTPRIAVISAFSPEISILLGQTTVETSYTVNGVDFVTGNLAGNDVVLFLSGVSMVNAAMNTQLVIDRFNITHIIYSGIAGGVNPAYHIGDVVIAAQWGQYQEAYAARELADGTIAAPDPAPYPPFNFMFPQPVSVRSSLIPSGEDKFWFEVDPQMLAVAGSVASTVVLASCTADNVCLTDPPVVHVGGSGVSGQTFVDNAEYREYVYDTFGADALDMETAAAAMVAYANGVPFLAFRSLSDLAGGGPGANEIGTFFQLAADNSAAVTIAFLSAWASQ